jgi:2-polyprenyl-3-methyl-5-hydroxy-6-metoxy-1,4-benzoquinol methylase
MIADSAVKRDMLSSSNLSNDFREIPETLYGPRKRLVWVYSVLRKLKNPKVLDVGCGTGDLLTIPLAKRGIDITGTDIHQESIDHAKTASAGLSNAKFICGSLQDVVGKYDVVILSEVLEHVDKPIDLLAALKSLLTAEGVLLLTVPNGYGPFEMDQSLWKRNFLGIPTLHARYVQRRGGGASAATLNDDNPHVNFFTKAALENVTRAAGFRIIDFKSRTFIAGSFPAIFLHLLRMVGIPTAAIVDLNARISDSLPLNFASDWMLTCVADNHNK